MVAAVAGLLALAAFVGWYHHEAGAHDAIEARQLLAKALHTGHFAALDGLQRVDVAGSRTVHAHLVQSVEGRMRIEYLDGSNKGRTIWDNGTLVWRWSPARKRMTIARCRRGSDVLDPRR